MKNSKVFIGIISAAVVGAVIGLLCAPDEGTKTIKKIRKKTNNLASDLIDALEKSKEKAQGKVEDMKDKGESYINRAKSKGEDVADHAAALKEDFHSK